MDRKTFYELCQLHRYIAHREINDTYQQLCDFVENSEKELRTENESLKAAMSEIVKAHGQGHTMDFSGCDICPIIARIQGVLK